MLDAAQAGGTRGQRGEVRDRHHRQAGAVGKSLGDPRGNAQAGEAAGPAAEGDGVERSEGDAALGQHLLHHRQDPLRVPAAQHLVALEDRAIDGERGRAGLGCGVDGQDLHAVPTLRGPRPASASRRLRKRTASSPSSISVAGGSDSMNSRP